jgi:hypothetical protein
MEISRRLFLATPGFLLLPGVVPGGVIRYEWDRRINKLPVLFVEGLKEHAKAGTLPDRAEFRFEKADGTLWGGLGEAVTIEPRDWVKLFPKEPWRAEVRHDLFRLAWCLHRSKNIKRKGVVTKELDREMAVRLLTYRARALNNHGFVPQWLPSVAEMPVVALQWAT